MDPLNNINNVGGKDTNIERLQTMLKTVFYGMKTGNKPLDYLFQLHNIFE